MGHGSTHPVLLRLCGPHFRIVFSGSVRRRCLGALAWLSAVEIVVLIGGHIHVPVGLPARIHAQRWCSAVSTGAWTRGDRQSGTWMCRTINARRPPIRHMDVPDYQVHRRVDARGLQSGTWMCRTIDAAIKELRNCFYPNFVRSFVR